MSGSHGFDEFYSLSQQPLGTLPWTKWWTLSSRHVAPHKNATFGLDWAIQECNDCEGTKKVFPRMKKMKTSDFSPENPVCVFLNQCFFLVMYF